MQKKKIGNRNKRIYWLKSPEHGLGISMEKNLNYP